MTSKFKDDYYFQFKTQPFIIRLFSKHNHKIQRIHTALQKSLHRMGRSIMQGRKDRKYDFHRERAYLEKIRKDNLVKKYERFYKGVRKGIEKLLSESVR